ncbi:MAG: hypothetical protein SFV19_04710 [Rhodospirillaceae bacterium]|nr:hypothetical protein [Rhodospirillaceae bacterium]
MTNDNETRDKSDAAKPALASAPIASTTVDFARLGLNQIAYIRPAIVNDAPGWSIHAATGDTLGAAATFEQAWGAVMQNNLAPVRVH